MPPKQMQGQLITTSGTHWVLCVNYSEVPHVGEAFHPPPQSVLSSLVSSHQQPAEVGSAPEGSTVQLSTSAERRTQSEAEDVKISTVLQRRDSAPAARVFFFFFHVSPGDKSFLVNALCSGATLSIFFFLFFNFSHL